MKVFLCCILALCVVQSALSDRETDRLSNQLWNLQFQAMQQINDITNPILRRIQDEVNDAKAQGKNAQPCYERARILMKSYVDPSFSALRTCRTNALAAKSVQMAISCNSGVVDTFRNNAQTVPPVAKSCLASL